MSLIGKKVRLERIMNRKDRKTVIVPMDHGVTVGPITGLEDLPEMVNKVAEGGADAVLGHLFVPLYGHRGYGRDMVHSILDAGEEFNLQPAGETRFKNWISSL